MNFAAQRSPFAYDERPCAIVVKRLATESLGYAPDDYETSIRRDESDDILYDQVL